MNSEETTAIEEEITVSPEGASDQPPNASTQEEPPQMLTPVEWGRALGKLKRTNLWFGGEARGEVKSPDYLVAEHLHGWIEAELRGRPQGARKLLITREDFDAALKAAMTANEKTGAYTPHRAALAPHLRGDA